MVSDKGNRLLQTRTTEVVATNRNASVPHSGGVLTPREAPMMSCAKPGGTTSRRMTGGKKDFFHDICERWEEREDERRVGKGRRISVLQEIQET